MDDRAVGLRDAVLLEDGDDGRVGGGGLGEQDAARGVAVEAVRGAQVRVAGLPAQEREGDLEVKKNELDEIMQETRAEEEKLKEKVKDLESKIESRLLTSFKRIRKNARNGLGVVYVQRDACGGCFNKIPPQRQLDIKMHKKVIVCEYCGRIMIDPELAGVKIDKATGEEKKTRKRAIRKSASSKKTTDANDME